MCKQKPNSHTFKLLPGLIFSLALSGCATTNTPDANDPWQGMNRGTQNFNDSFDKNILKPVAIGYKNVTNSVIDDGVTNFFSNINDIGVTINDVLQFKLLQSGMDFSRFLVNTTIGIAGVIDVASKIDLPKHHEDFGQTLGFWGIPTGPYFVLPFVGPSTPRDAIGRLGDAAMDPLTYISIFGGFVGTAASGGSSALDVTDTRAGLMSTEKLINEGSAGDRYDFIKNAYLQHREFLIHDGSTDESEDPMDGNDSLDTSGKSSNTTGNTTGNTNKQAISDPKNNPYKPDKNGLPPVQNNSKHYLELTAPEEKK